MLIIIKVCGTKTFHGKGWSFSHEIRSKDNLLDLVLGCMPKNRKKEDILIIRIANVVRYDVQLKTKKCEYLDQSAVNPLPKNYVLNKKKSCNRLEYQKLYDLKMKALRQKRPSFDIQ